MKKRPLRDTPGTAEHALARVLDEMDAEEPANSPLPRQSPDFIDLWEDDELPPDERFRG